MKKTEAIKIAIICSSFWEEVAKGLEKNCIETLTASGISNNNIDIINVPGSLEIPLIAKKLAKKKIYDAIIAFGAIHKGKTYHFEMIANECIKGCMAVSLEFEIPVIFEVLAVYKIQDAIERSSGDKDNRGREAAHAALSMINLLTEL